SGSTMARARSTAQPSPGGCSVRPPDAPPLVDPLRAAGPLLVAQDELLDLAGAGLRQLAELDRLGRLEAGQVLTAERDDLFGGRLGARLEGHEGLRHFAPSLV